MKRTVYPLYAPADESRVKPILDALREKGVTMRTASPRPGDALLLFLSGNVKAEGPEADAFFRLNAGRELVIPVNLDGVTPPEALQNALMARHALDGSKYEPKDLASRIAAAAMDGGKSRLPLILPLIGAAAVLLVGGLIYWKNKPEPPVPPSPVTEVTSSAPAPLPTEAPRVPGIEVDLTKVAEVVFMGDEFRFYTFDGQYTMGSYASPRRSDDFAYGGWMNDGVHFYSKEDGHEYPHATLDDIGWLALLPNLRFLSLYNVTATLPDLSNLKDLREVMVSYSDLSDLEGLRGSTIQHLEYHGAGVSDFSPLTDCRNLRSVHLDLVGSPRADLSGFHPPKLVSLGMGSGYGVEGLDFSFLLQCPNLQELLLDGYPQLTDLSCLANAGNLTRLVLRKTTSLRTLAGLEGAPKLESLQLEDLDGLRTLEGLKDHRYLKTVNIFNAPLLRDISDLSGCDALGSLNMHKCFALEDVTPAVKLPNLRDLQVYGADINDVNFLWDIRNKEYFSFGIAEVNDWSGLSAIETYSFLNITDRNGSALPYVQNATITNLELWNRVGMSNQTYGLDVALLPHVTNELMLHCVRSLEGLDQPDARRLVLDDCPYLTSLSGLEGMPKMQELEIYNCPRLNDWSALTGRSIYEIRLDGLFSLPDFGEVTVRNISLATIFDLKDLSCFEKYKQDWYNISLMDVDGVTDLSPLYHLKGKSLQVPAHLMEQAQAMVDSGLLEAYQVVYPEGGWAPVVPDIVLMSLDEIDVLPSALLKRIEHLTLAGNMVVPEGAWVEEDRSANPPTLYLRYDDSQERIPVEPGTLTDLTCLQKLTGLRDLTVYAQPELVSLEGVQAMGELRRLVINQAPALIDASTVFTIQSLEDLSLRFTAVSSIQGVQNLYALKRLHVNDSPVADLSPLAACSDALEDVNFFLPMMTFEELKALPESVRRFIRSLSVAGAYVWDGGSWRLEGDWTTDPPKLYLHSNETDQRLPLQEGAVMDMGELAELLPNVESLNLFAQDLTTLDGVEHFSQLRSINIEECRRITDFSALWRTASLEDISLRNEPIESIEGIEQLPRLVSLSLSGAGVKDFSPLERVDYSYCVSEENGCQGFSLALDVMDGSKLTYEDYRALEAVPVYRSLNMNNVPADRWMDHVMDREIRQLSCHRCGMSDEQLKSFAEAHPMLEQLDLKWNPQITDLSCLEKLEAFRQLYLSRDMQAAVASLNGERGIRTDVE